MKAIRVHGFGDSSVLKFEDAPDPRAGTGQVVVRAKAIGVNPVDAYIRSGIYGEKTFPYTPGTDAAGEVEAIGSGVKKIQVGDRVYIYGSHTGAYAEKILCDESQVHLLPDHITFAQGAAIGVPYATAYYAIVNRANEKPGETVLIHGASGGVGTAAIQIAKSLGLRIFATAGTPKGRELVIQEGANEALDHHSSDYLDVLMKKTDAKGVDIILEMLANVNLGKDLKALARNGRVIVVGNRGEVTINPRELMPRNADIRGMSLLYATPDELAVIHAALGKGLKEGVFKPVVGREMPLAQAAQAQDTVMAPSGAHGKIVLIP